ncbi:ligand-binding sensor domain-containing protein [Flavobacterium sp. T12S277]|uniref:ligand-binding sensor domain-containing protein n=1 Tax=Flavobacterium sp. T12S277 TaxID=3402752 RepID=UPI003AE187A6
MKRKYQYYFYILMLLHINKVTSQEDYSMRWYTSDNNELPQSSVKSIVRDKYNFIWLTTENGVVRYDGNTFLAYNSSTTKLNGSRFADVSGSIKKDSLYCYNEGRKELVLINDRKLQIFKKNTPFHDIVKNGKFYFLHSGLPTIKTINTDSPFYINLSNDQKYFIDNKEIQLCDSKMKSIYKRSYKNKSVFNFFTLNDTLYYLYKNGKYDCISEKIRSKKIDLTLLNGKHELYWNMTANQVFLYSKDKIYLLRSKNNHLIPILIAKLKDFKNYNIASILYDSESKKLYMGSNTNGLCIITFSSFSTVKKKSSKAEVNYSNLAFNSNSIITPNGLILTSKEVIDSIPFKSSNYFIEKISMTKDSNGGIWKVYDGNLHHYLKKTGYKKCIKYGFNQEIKTLFNDLSNNIWISLQEDTKRKAKLFVIKNKFDKKPNLILNSIPNINYIAQKENSILLLGTQKGLFKYSSATNKLYFVKKTKSLNIRSIYIDRDKKVWITTYEKGFFLYLNNVIYSFPKDKNKYLNSSHCIIEDKKGFFWITTNKGLFQVYKKSLLLHIKDKTTKIYYYNYSKSDGFLTNEFNGGCQPCGNYLENNQITFPSMNGNVFFDPNNIKPLIFSKGPFIDKAIIDQKVTDIKDTIVLNNNFQRVKILIDYAYYGNLNNLDIQAKLFGINNSNWEEIGSNKSISFTTLPPGTYTLMIRSMPGFNSTYKYKKVTLIVLAEFYQTFTFKLFLVIIIITLILYLWQMRLLYLKIRNKKLKKIIIHKTQKLAKTIVKLKITKKNLKQEILQEKRLIQIISHDIKSPLRYLTLTISHIQDKIEKLNNEILIEQIKSVHISTLQLYEYVENLIKYSIIFIEAKKFQEENYSLQQLVETKIQLFKKIAISTNTIIINNTSPNEKSKINNKILSIIIHNLIDNAVKNTKYGQIEFKAINKKNKLFLTIKDTGIGMDEELINYYLNLSKKPSLQNHHLGLHMIIELLNILKGDIKITSEINEGTTIEIIIENN